MSQIFEELTREQQFNDINTRIEDLEKDIIEINKLNLEEIKLNSKQMQERKIKLDFILLKFNRIWNLICISKFSNETKKQLFQTLSDKIKGYEKGKTR